MRIIRDLILFLSISLIGSLSQSQYQLAESGIPIIEKITQSHKEKNLSLSEIDEIVKTISQDGLFQVVYAEEVQKGRVVIRAQQSNKLKNIFFSGNSHLSNDELLKIMNTKSGESLSEIEIDQFIEKIKQAYKDAGYYNFKIDYSRQQVSGGMNLKISIDEQKNCIIEDLKIFTKNDFLEKLFKELIIKYKKQAFQKKTNDLIYKEINDLLLEHRFLTSRIENTSQVFNRDKTKVKIVFTISNPIQFEFIFHGNNHFSHFDLVKKSKIGQKFLYLSDSSAEIVESVTELYLKQGFPEIKIKESSQYFSSMNKKVFVFEISEGTRIRIGKVQVSGKISRKKSYYTKLFNDYLAQESHSVYFVRKDVEHAAENMVTHLKREGHLLADLLAVTPTLTDQHTADIDIQIDEGILTYVRQILFRGSKSFSNIRLKEVAEIEANKPLNLQKIETSFKKLEFFYRNQAYLEFEIMNRNASVIQYKSGQPYADIVYQIKEGPKIKVKEIRIKGNTKTKDYVLRRELDFSPGDFLTLDRVSLSSDRLEKTGLFGKVDIRSLEQGSSNPNRTIVIDVEERKPGLFSAGVGLLNENFLTYRGYLGVLYNNLGGKARALSSRVDLKFRQNVEYLENRVALSYYEPYISNDRLRGRFSLVREQELFEFATSSNKATILSTNEFRFSVDRELSRHLHFTYNVWGFSNQETFKINEDGQVANDANGNKILNIGTTGPVIEFDYRNHQFLPTKGTFTRVEMEYSDPILGSSKDNPGTTGLNFDRSPIGRREDENNEIQYVKLNFSTARYTPLAKNNRWVWANSLSGGYLSNLSSREDSGIPASRAFFLGGSSTLRGFNSLASSETVPGKRELCLNQGLIDIGDQTNSSDTSDPGCELADIFIRKDSFYFLFKSELRFPISGNFGGLLFYDGGGVYISDFSLEDPYRDSIGFGLRYDTPVGSFTVEFGYKLDRKRGALDSKFDEESDIAIHLAIGTF